MYLYNGTSYEVSFCILEVEKNYKTKKGVSFETPFSINKISTTTKASPRKVR